MELLSHLHISVTGIRNRKYNDKYVIHLKQSDEATPFMLGRTAPPISVKNPDYERTIQADNPPIGQRLIAFYSLRTIDKRSNGNYDQFCMGHIIHIIIILLL